MKKPFSPSACTYAALVRLAGVDMELRCDSPDMLAWIRRLFLGEGFAAPPDVLPAMVCHCAVQCEEPWVLAFETPGGLHLARRHRKRPGAFEFVEWTPADLHSVGESWLPGPVPTTAEAEMAILVEYVRRRLMRAAINHAGGNDLRVVHAAALQEGDACVLMLGSPHSGKSTLALAGAAAGMRYLAEEHSIVDLGRRIVHPFPTPFRMREGSGTLSSAFARIPRNETIDMAGDVRWLVDPTSLGPEAVGSATRLTHAVHLGPRSGMPRIEPLGVAELAGTCIEAEVLPGRVDVLNLLWRWSGCLEPAARGILYPGPPDATVQLLRAWLMESRG